MLCWEATCLLRTSLYKRSWESGVLGKIWTTNSRMKWQSHLRPMLPVRFSAWVTRAPPLSRGCHPSQVSAPLSPQWTPSALPSGHPFSRALVPQLTWSFPALSPDWTHSQLTFPLFQIQFFLCHWVATGVWSSPALLPVQAHYLLPRR